MDKKTKIPDHLSDGGEIRLVKSQLLTLALQARVS